MKLYRNKKNATGYTGVIKRGNRFAAFIQVDNKKIYLGAFTTAEEAATAYAKAVDEMLTE